LAPEVGSSASILMSVDDLGELASTTCCLLLEDWEYPMRKIRQLKPYTNKGNQTHSGGLAGSMMTASFVLSSDTK